MTRLRAAWNTFRACLGGRGWNGWHPRPTEMRMTAKAAIVNSSKHDRLLKLLRSKKGATIVAMQKATGWQPHSIRGFLSGTVKKRLGLTIQSAQRKGGERHYQIIGH